LFYKKDNFFNKSPRPLPPVGGGLRFLCTIILLNMGKVKKYEKLNKPGFWFVCSEQPATELKQYIYDFAVESYCDRKPVVSSSLSHLGRAVATCGSEKQEKRSSPCDIVLSLPCRKEQTGFLQAKRNQFRNIKKRRL